LILAVLFKSFVFLAPKDSDIIWFCNLLTLIVSGEDYSRHSALDIYLYIQTDRNMG
jgi:hypothetical protein